MFPKVRCAENGLHIFIQNLQYNFKIIIALKVLKAGDRGGIASADIATVITHAPP